LNDLKRGTAGRAILVAVQVLSALPVAAAEVTETAEEGEQVVITATKRTMPALDIPASVSVFTSDRLAGARVDTVKQLSSLTPAMSTINSIGESFGQLVTVRGIATSGADIGLESAAGITLDGVPLSRPNVALFDLQGIERIEFLRGPQGTLYGKNTTSGLINVLTQRPGFTPYFEASGTLGERNLKEVRVTAEGGLGGTRLAGRIDALYGTIDGYLQNPNTGRSYGGRERKQIRGQLLFAPSQELDVRVIADYFRHDGTVNSAVYRYIGATGGVISQLTGLPLIASHDARDLSQIDDLSPRFEKSDSAGAVLEANWQTSLGRFTALASYRTTTSRRSYDVDNSPADIARDPNDGERFNAATAELRLQGVTGRLDYLFGAHVGGELITSRDSYTFGTDFDPYAQALSSGTIPTYTGLPAGQNFPAGSGMLDVFRQRSTNYALFTHHVFAITEQLTLTGGLRYTRENKSLDATITSDNPGCSSALSLLGSAFETLPPALKALICIPNLDPRYDGVYATERDGGDWSGTAAISRRFWQSWNAYFSYSRGYKAGGFQLDRSGMAPSAPSLSQLAFDEETADSFEAGIKGFALDDAWRLSAAVFRTTFHDYQFSWFSGFNRITTNVPELETKGVELETAYRPLDALELSFSGIYQEARFGNSGFPIGLTQVQDTTPPLAPRWVLAGTVAYSRPVGGVIGFGNIDVRWQSRAYVGASADPARQDFYQDSYAVVGARIGAQSLSGDFKVEVWARNVFNQRSWSILNNTTLQPAIGGVPSTISGFVIEPRTFGVTLTGAW
jgi:outer membrane receptor protein involved in Fe transport